MRRATLLVTAFVVATAVLEYVFRHLAHPEFIWHKIPAFDFVYGALGCAAIVIVSKWLGKHFLQRPEDYWEKTQS